MYRLVQISELIREGSLCSRLWLVWGLTTGLTEENVSEVLTHKLDIYLTHIQGSGIIVEEGAERF